MQINEFFDFKRFWNLCRYALGREKKDIISHGWKLFVIFFILTLFFRMTGNGLQPMYSIYMIVIISGGIYSALNTFRNLYDKEGSIAWLMIPGSSFEKFLSKIIYLLVIYFALLSFIYMLGVNAASFFSSLLFDINLYVFIPFGDVGFLNGYTVYFLLVSMFFTGGLYFKRHPFIKTVFFILIVSLFIQIIIAASGALIAAGFFSYLVRYLPEILKYWGKVVPGYFKILFIGIIPVFCWLISYFRLKEKLIVDS